MIFSFSFRSNARLKINYSLRIQISISKKFKELIIEICLKFILVHRWSFFARFTNPPVNHYLNFAQLLISPILGFFVFIFMVLPFFIKLISLLFLELLAFSLRVHRRLYLRIHKPLVLYIGKYNVHFGFLSEPF